MTSPNLEGKTPLSRGAGVSGSPNMLTKQEFYFLTFFLADGIEEIQYGIDSGEMMSDNKRENEEVLDRLLFYQNLRDKLARIQNAL